jgi:hypothetical protein
MDGFGITIFSRRDAEPQRRGIIPPAHLRNG